MSLRVAALAATCLPWHQYGGLERHVFGLCRWLRRRGVEVDLFTSRPEHDEDPFADDLGFRLQVIPGIPFVRTPNAVVLSRNTLYPIFSLRMGRRVVREAVARGYSAVIAQGLTGFGFAFWSARASLRVPLIVNPQGMEEATTPSAVKRAAYIPFRALARYAARRAAFVVATDHTLVEPVRRVFGLSAERILVIPNAIDVSECVFHVEPARRRKVLEALEATKALPLIVTVGRLAPNKGFEVGLAALARVRRNLPSSWRWIIVGDGPLRERLVRRSQQLSLSTNVRFVGNLPDADMHNLLAGADLFLNPTLYEGSSLVTLEAMSHGCPIVASRAGGIPDKIEEGVTGWLAEPNDADSLAEAILRWWSADHQERLRVGQAALARSKELFDWPSCVDRYIEAIRLSASEVRDSPMTRRLG